MLCADTVPVPLCSDLSSIPNTKSQALTLSGQTLLRPEVNSGDNDTPADSESRVEEEKCSELDGKLTQDPAYGMMLDCSLHTVGRKFTLQRNVTQNRAIRVSTRIVVSASRD